MKEHVGKCEHLYVFYKRVCVCASARAHLLAYRDSKFFLQFY